MTTGSRILVLCNFFFSVHLELGSSGFGGFGPSSGTIGASLPSHSSLSFRPETENFKAGDLFNQQEDYSHGHLVSETVQQGDMPLHRGPMSASGYVSPPRPEFGYLPYPYDYRFLTGKYPVGTYTHTSVSHSAGGRHWEDKHYVRYDPRPERPTETSNEPLVLQNVQAPSQQNPVQYRGARIQQTAPYGSAGLGQQVVYRQERRQAEGKVRVDKLLSITGMSNLANFFFFYFQV